MEKDKKQNSDFSDNKISRKDAIKKAGYMAASAATMMVLLGKSKNAQGTGYRPPHTSPAGQP